MAITVNIYYKGTEENLTNFVNEMMSRGIAEKIRNQEGNLKYEYYKPLENNNKILLIDQWSSQESLDIHHASPMMNEIIDLRNKYKLEMEVERYIEDNDSVTDNDRKYIK